MFNGYQNILLLPRCFLSQGGGMRDNIWFTYKARIQAHKRLEWLDLHSQLLLVWYAILGAVLSILTIRYPDVLGCDTDLLAAILSLTLLAISLSVTNRDFRGRAMLMRRNYLDLQKLYTSMSAASAITQDDIDQYNKLLGDSENHKGIDDILSRVFAIGLTSRKPSAKECTFGIFWVAIRFLVTVFLYVVPVWMAIHFLRKT